MAVEIHRRRQFIHDLCKGDITMFISFRSVQTSRVFTRNAVNSKTIPATPIF